MLDSIAILYCSRHLIYPCPVRLYCKLVKVKMKMKMKMKIPRYFPGNCLKCWDLRTCLKADFMFNNVEWRNSPPKKKKESKNPSEIKTPPKSTEGAGAPVLLSSSQFPQTGTGAGIKLSPHFDPFWFKRQFWPLQNPTYFLAICFIRPYPRTRGSMTRKFA